MNHEDARQLSRPQFAPYRSRLRLVSACRSPWQADTLFGHLCWYLARSIGTRELHAFLGRYAAGIPLVLLSDGFPSDFMPRPVWLPASRGPDGSKAERVGHRLAAKKRVDTGWLTLTEFNSARQGKPIAPTLGAAEVAAAVKTNIGQRNQIDRITDTAGTAAGALYDVEETIIPEITVYWRIADDSVDLVKDFLTDLTFSGYGKRKSVGYGNVESFTLEEFGGFAPVDDANGFVTLSRFVPAPTDPTDGYWNTAVKYGRLAEDFGLGNPFKRPLIQIDTGSCFYDNTPREWYGQLLSGLSVREEVKHYAYALALPVRLP